MPIYLDEQTGPMLLMLLKRELKRLPTNFVADRLLKMVETDDARKEQIRTCEHDHQPLYGYHEHCGKCSGLKNGFEYFGNEKLTQEEYQRIGTIEGDGERTTHQSQDFGNAAPTIPTQPDQA